MGREPRVGGQLGAAHGVAQPGEHRVGVAGDHHLGSIGRRVDVRGRHARQHAARALTLHATQLEVGHRGLHQGSHCLVDGDVHLLAPARGPRLGERGQRADHPEHGGQRITQADAGARRWPVGAARGVADAAHSLTDAAEAGVFGPRPALAVARDVHHHERRVGGRQHVVGEAPLVEAPRPEVLDDEVAVGGEPRDHRPGPLVAEIERDRALVPGDGRPPQAVPVEGDAPAPHRVALARRLDLQDVGPVVAEELPRERAGDEAAQLQHPHAAERAVAGRGRAHLGRWYASRWATA